MISIKCDCWKNFSLLAEEREKESSRNEENNGEAKKDLY